MTVIKGNHSANNLQGSAGDDIMYGYGGDDSLAGGPGHNTLFGGTGADMLTGLRGIDTASYADSDTGVYVSLLSGTGIGGTAQGDTLIHIENLNGSNHADLLIGEGGRNELKGLGGDDTLIGGGGIDELWGGTGDDALKGGGGADALNGGEGNDTVVYADSPQGVMVNLLVGAGFSGAAGDSYVAIENVTGSEHNDTVFGDGNANVMAGLGGHNFLFGEGGDDTLFGGDDGNALFGGSGDDSLHGGSGGDGLDGNSGADALAGGFGDDYYWIDNWYDAVTEYGGQGNDTVATSISWALPAGADIERFRTSSDEGTTPIALIGNSSGNVVIGNDGQNMIGGGDGNDELTGRGGQDSFLFNTALSAATNVDVIADFNVAEDTILLDQDIFSSSLGLGNISAGELVLGTAAQDANDRIIYNSSTGALYYDSDGVGGSAAIQFAELEPGLSLTFEDFLIV